MATEIILNPNHPYAEAAESNVANVFSRIQRWSPPPGVELILGAPEVEPSLRRSMRRGQFFPVIKLYQNGGTELPGDSEIQLVARRSGARDGVPLVTFDYGVFRDLSSANQRNSDYKASVLLSMPSWARIANEGYLEVHVKSSVVVDLSEAGTFLEFRVLERNGS